MRELCSTTTDKNNTICLFSSYFATSRLPFFVQFYLMQLKPHCARILLITNDDRTLDQSSINWLEQQNIELMLVKNEGYDFGMWQKAIRHLGDLAEYNRLCLSNDSCICYAPLDDFFGWLNRAKPRASGLVKSFEKSPHLQSYLLAFSEEAKSLVVNYLKNICLEKGDYDEIVKQGELGLSQKISSAGIELEGYFEPTQATDENPSFLYFMNLLDQGIPMIKRKLLGYPPGFLIKHAIRARLGIRRHYYIAKILAKYPERTETLKQLLANLPPYNVKEELKLWRRVLRYWLAIRLRLI